MIPSLRLLVLTFAAILTAPASAQLAIKADTLHTMAGPVLTPGVLLIDASGKISAVGGPEVPIPADYPVLSAKVAVPGLIDVRGTVGVSGLFNSAHDSDQLDRSSPIQPELRALDAFNPKDDLVAWVRSLGVTTINTGHAPGELISGQLAAFKTSGTSVEASLVKELTFVAATLGPWAQKGGGSPGTRAKMVAMLREQLIKAREYVDSQHVAATKADGSPNDPASPPARDLRLEMLGRVIKGEVPLLVTANRAQDIASVLRLKEEFKIPVVLDSGAEAYLMLDELKASGVPVVIHPTMYRMFGEMENMSVETAAKLRAAGIPFAIQSGYESYVPKTRIVLFEAAIAAANGLSFEAALASITIDAAKLLGLADRLGSLEVGKDGDVALYDGDPFEYTTHCVGTVIDGKPTGDQPR